MTRWIGSWRGSYARQVDLKQKRRQRQALLLARIARRGEVGMQVDVRDPDVRALQRMGFVRVRRCRLGEMHSGVMKRNTKAYITEKGWTALWSENLASTRPVPKSQRREKRSRHV